jgi:crotonobetainyl-CoA:carnitine CoA-transferase CaiB-like acyl-CoA transferase
LSARAGGRATGSIGAGCAIDWSGPVDAPLHDEVAVQAACGLMHVHGRRFGAPRALHVEYAGASAGVLAATGLLAALVARRRGLELTTVETSVAQAGLLVVAQYLAAATADDDEWTETLLPGGPPFVSADGVRFELEALRAEVWVAFWTLLDADRAALRGGWRAFEQRFATGTCPLPADLFAATRRRSFDELTRLATVAGISIVALRDGAAGRAARAEAGTAGRPPCQITSLSSVAATAAPAATASTKLPLEGLVVIEATRRLQGPLAGHILSLLGAAVTHVEPPGGDPLRGAPPLAGGTSARFLALNRLKGRVEADITTPAGRRTVRELVASADVFVHNWAPGKAAQLELDAADLEAISPGLVYAYASAWGTRLGAGPGLGTDYMVQAYSGLGAALRPGKSPIGSLMTLTDILGGLVCAEGVLGGLLARLTTGHGQRVDSSLLSAATVLLEPCHAQAGPERYAQAGDPERDSPQPGSEPLREPLATADGYVALSRPTRARPREVATALGLALGDLRAIPGAIVDAVAGERTQTAIDSLRAAGLDATEVCTDLAELAADARFAPALERGACTLPRPPWTFSR